MCPWTCCWSGSSTAHDGRMSIHCPAAHAPTNTRRTSGRRRRRRGPHDGSRCGTGQRRRLRIATAASIRDQAAWGRHVETVVEAERALLFLDELTTCPPTVMNALLPVCQERVVGDLQLPDSVAIVAAANPPSMAVNGQELSAPIANRFLHLTWVGDHQAWWDGLFTDFAAASQPSMTDLIGRHRDEDALRAGPRCSLSPGPTEASSTRCP